MSLRSILLGTGLVAALVVGCSKAGDPSSSSVVEVSVPAGRARSLDLPGSAVDLVLLPAGSFSMGASPDDPHAASNEKPRHEVRISKDLWVATTETTVGAFRAFVDETGYVTEAEKDPAGGWIVDPKTEKPRQVAGVSWRSPGFEQSDDHPVVQVSWNDAAAYCEWLSERSGLAFRLPTEAEWEYVARAGGTEPHGSHADPTRLHESANLADASLLEVHALRERTESWNDGYAYTAPVGRGKPNPWGLFDMTGNAWEWCADAHDDDFYARSPKVDPFNAPTSDRQMRAIRGGGWFDDHTRARVSTRAWFFPVFRTCQLSGFRVVAERTD